MKLHQLDAAFVAGTQQQPGQPPRQKRFAGAGRPLHQQVAPPAQAGQGRVERRLAHKQLGPRFGPRVGGCYGVAHCGLGRVGQCGAAGTHPRPGYGRQAGVQVFGLLLVGFLAVGSRAGGEHRPPGTNGEVEALEHGIGGCASRAGPAGGRIAGGQPIRALGHGARRVAPAPVHQLVHRAGRQRAALAGQLAQGAQHVLAGEHRQWERGGGSN